LVRIFCWEDAKGSCSLGHASLDALAAGEHYMLNQLTVSAQPSCWFSPPAESVLEQWLAA
jgi:hypothetical protein